ncbi:MAG TPA: peroxiredoxin [Methylophilus sp.]|uniref:peroxiredoxin n=1 Tax=Methylophilus sp. TaxID=29541 RepID=UPI002CC3E7D4|nr:peroxiredoxin [Methylophilus sp.]HSH86258.1 peroxiredoxin [Methylophilus sp.]
MLVKLIMYGLILWLAVWGYRQYNQPSARLSVGMKAPDFKLPDAQGGTRRLADWQGKWVVLYFYPKDDTPGCTKEACQFRDDIQQIHALGAEVVGISVDNAASHAEFAHKHRLPFPLLADTNGQVADAYGTLFNLVVIKVAKRTTFVIDPQGTIAEIYSNVNPDGHSHAIINDLKRLSAF